MALTTTASVTRDERPSEDRIAWIDYAKGICLVAVVCFYTHYYVQDVTGSGWMQYWVDFARPFRMPDFFLIAGLFLARTIDRPWRDYLDRKVVHFVYFLVLWTTIYFAAELLLTGNLAGTVLWLEYLRWYVDPYHMLWFIAMLPVYFLVTRALRGIPWWLVLGVAALLQIWGPESGWRHLDRFSERYVYFYAGYALAPLAFQLTDWARQNKRQALGALAIWAVINQSFVALMLHEKPGISLVLGFAGTAAVMGVGALLQGRRSMAWLAYLGRHSIVVFLAFYIPMVAAAKLLWKFHPPLDAGTQALLIVVAGVAAPIALSWVVRRTPLRLLFERPSWAKVGAAPRPAVATVNPAANPLPS